MPKGLDLLQRHFHGGRTLFRKSHKETLLFTDPYLWVSHLSFIKGPVCSTPVLVAKDDMLFVKQFLSTTDHN